MSDKALYEDEINKIIEVDKEEYENGLERLKALSKEFTPLEANSYLEPEFLSAYETIFDFLEDFKEPIKDKMKELYPGEADKRAGFLFQTLFMDLTRHIFDIAFKENTQLNYFLSASSIQKASDILHNAPERPRPEPENADEIFYYGLIGITETITGINLTRNNKQASEKKTYRTAQKAKEVGADTKTRKLKSLPIITDKHHQWGLSFYNSNNDKPHLQPFTSIDGLEFKNGNLYFTNHKLLSEIELQDIFTHNGIENIDLSFLRACFSYIFYDFQTQLPQILKNNNSNQIKYDKNIKVYAPTFFEFLYGRKPNNEELTNLIKNDILQYQTIIGVMPRSEYKIPSMYPVLLFHKYDADTNTVEFSSPYINYLISSIYQHVMKKDRKGKLKIKANGLPEINPAFSTMIYPEILKTRCKVAIDIVVEIVRIIEQTGNKGTPNVSIEYLIETIPQLKMRLESTQKPNRLLKTVFPIAWKLLQEKTKLSEEYPGIQLPNPNDKDIIPTMRNYKTLIIKIPHNGKRTALKSNKKIKVKPSKN